MKMKKLAALIAALTVAAWMLVVFASCGSSPASSGSGAKRKTSNDLYSQLDPVIEKTFGNLNTRLKPGLRIALLPPGSTDEGAGKYVFDELYKRFINSGCDMVDRADIDKAIAEINFSMSGLVDDNTAASLGKFLGAQVIAFGDLPELGSTRQRLVYRALEVETGRMLGISSERF
ncbi:MAG: penicillin-binding protein activator LpoB [Treponema sp.]|jgi:hypothetical protein|nr:penicillin-binding protein activator LpoB [Treponema sp.]